MSENQRRHYLMLLRRGFPEAHARRLAHGRWIGIGLVTNKAFVAGRGDGFGTDEKSRKIAYRNARKAGVNPAGKIWSPQLARPGMGLGRDPLAWLDPSQARSQVKAVCQKRGVACDGSVTVKEREPETDPCDKPYEVAESIVRDEVQDILSEHGSEMTSKEKSELHDQTKERLSGNR